MDGVRDTELGDAQRAARLLLDHGVVSETRVGKRDWRNLRRYAEPLGEAFARTAGYRVDVGRSAISLVRRLDRLGAAPVFTTPSGQPFDRLRYGLVLLVLAALERSGQQTTLTDLARRVRASAEALPDLPFDPDQHASRLALSHAVRALEDLGALALTDGSREAWERASLDGEALYDIDLALCRRLFPVLVGPEDAGERLLHRDPEGLGRDPTLRARRQRLARQILERSVVYLDDLADDERSYLVREGRSLARELEDLTGAQVERRREGLALVAPGRSLSDRPFPSGGGANQAALLLASRMVPKVAELPRLEAPHADEGSDRLLAALAPGSEPSSPRPRARRPFIDDESLLALATELVRELAPALTLRHHGHPSVFLADGVEVLTAHELVRPMPGGLVLMPALARFGEVRLRAADELAGQLRLGFA
jgi:uncharacterized protein (TIGR02678 family)